MYHCDEILSSARSKADVDLFEGDEETWGIRVDYHNNTNKIQHCLLNLFAAIEYPQSMTCEPELPKKREFWKALDHQGFEFAISRPWENLFFDGMRRGEQFRADFTGGMALAETFYAMMYRNRETKCSEEIQETGWFMTECWRTATRMQC